MSSVHVRYILLILVVLAAFLAFDVRSWFIPPNTTREDQLERENKRLQASFDSLAALDFILVEAYEKLQEKDDSLQQAYHDLEGREITINTNTHERIRRIDSSHADGIVSFFAGIDPESLR